MEVIFVCMYSLYRLQYFARMVRDHVASCGMSVIPVHQYWTDYSLCRRGNREPAVASCKSAFATSCTSFVYSMHTVLMLILSTNFSNIIMQVQKQEG